MAVSQSSEALRRPQRILYIAFPVLALVSLVLGYIGLHELAVMHHEKIRISNLIYNDFQLFVLGSDPLQGETKVPMALAIARFTAPAFTLYAAIEAFRLLLSVELSRWRARRSKGHAIVCGDSTFADALTRRLQSGGVDVVEIRLEADEYVSPGEPLRVLGDARDPEVLQAAGIDRAATIYACTEQGATNIAIALAVSRAVTRDGDPLYVHSLVEDSEFCATVQAFFLGRPQHGRVRLDFFDVDHIAARRLIADNVSSSRLRRLMVAGSEGLAAAVVVEAARQWRLKASVAQRLTIIVVDPGASGLVDGLVGRYPFLAQVCRLEAVDDDLLAMLLDDRQPAPADRVLITHRDEEHALKTAMTAERRWHGRSGPITVRLDGALIGGSVASGRLEVAPEVLNVFGAVTAAADPMLIRDDLVERLARVLHDRYLLGRLLRGEVPRTPADRALVPWDDLPAPLRHANRTQAEDIGRKLASIGYVIIPRHSSALEVVLADDDVQRLAMLEHERWCTEQTGAGWQYDESFDEERKRHPGLLSWDALPETMRSRNVDPVRELPAILGEAGFHIVRTLPLADTPAGR